MANLSNINNKFLVTDEGKVGIGITAPTGILHTDQTFSGYAPVTFKNSVTNQGQFVELITSTDEGSKYTGIESKSLQTGNGWKVWGGGNNFGEMYLSVSGAHAIVIKSDLKVGIGTTDPNVKLRIAGTQGNPATSGSTSTGFLSLYGAGASHGLMMGVQNVSPFGSWIQAQDKSNHATNYNLLLNPNGGNVGIGTASPGTYGPATGTVKLDVKSGDIIRSGFNNPANSWIGFTSLPGYAANSYPSVTSKSSIHFANNDKYCAFLEGTDTYFGILNSASTTKVFLATGSQNSYLAGSGNVGIGTTTPDAKLEVEGNVNSGFFSVYAKNTNAGSSAYVSKKWLNNDAGFGEIWRNSSARNGGAGNTASSFNMYNSNDIHFWSSGIHTMALVNNNVGIGTTLPATSYGFSRTLEIQGAANAEINISQSNNSKDWSLGIVNGANYQQTTSGQDYIWIIGGSEKMRITSGGDFGFNETIITNPYSQSNFTDLNIDGVWGGVISFKLGGSEKGWIGQRNSGNAGMALGASAGQPLYFATNGNNTRMVILSGGNVGIGTTDPETKLEVAGSIASGTATAPTQLTYKGNQIKGFVHNFDKAKSANTGTAVNVTLVDISGIGNFHQAMFYVQYGTRLQSLSDNVTGVVVRAYGVNRFNGGTLQVTETSAIAGSSNSLTHALVNVEIVSNTQYRLRIEFSSTIGGSSFASGLINGFAVSDSFPTITFAEGTAG